MKIDWRIAGGVVLVIVLCIVVWRATHMSDPTKPTVNIPAGANPVTQPTPESETPNATGAKALPSTLAR